MKKKTFQINIPKPCKEDWNTMTPNEKGRHCANCAKTVIDFTTKADWEIVDAYKKMSGKLCGRFKSTQVNRTVSLESPLMRHSRWKAASLLLGGFLTAAACNPNPTGTLGEPMIETIELSDQHGKKTTKPACKNEKPKYDYVWDDTLAVDNKEVTQSLGVDTTVLVTDVNGNFSIDEVKQ